MEVEWRLNGGEAERAAFVSGPLRPAGLLKQSSDADLWARQGGSGPAPVFSFFSCDDEATQA